MIENAIDVETMQPIKTFAVLFLFTHSDTYLQLQFKGDIFSKLQLAVEFNIKSGEKVDAANVRK